MGCCSSKTGDDVVILPYESLRKDLQTFDLVYWSERNTLSHGVCTAGDFAFSHVGVVFRFDDNVCVVNAGPKFAPATGLDDVPISFQVQNLSYLVSEVSDVDKLGVRSMKFSRKDDDLEELRTLLGVILAEKVPAHQMQFYAQQLAPLAATGVVDVSISQQALAVCVIYQLCGQISEKAEVEAITIGDWIQDPPVKCGYDDVQILKYHMTKVFPYQPFAPSQAIVHEGAMSYQKLRDGLKTGDLLYLTSKFVNGSLLKCGGGKWSHVGMILHTEGGMFVVMAGNNRIMADSFDPTVGIDRALHVLNLRSLVLSGWYDQIAVRRLNHTKRGTEQLLKDVNKFRQKMMGVQYDQAFIGKIGEALGPAAGMLTQRREDISSLLSGEFVACVYREEGILPKNLPSTAYTTMDFAGTVGIEHGALEDFIFIGGM